MLSMCMLLMSPMIRTHLWFYLDRYNVFKCLFLANNFYTTINFQVFGINDGHKCAEKEQGS